MNLEQAVRATDQLMLDVVDSDVPVLSEASRHIISAGGKRIRPRMMFLSYQASGGLDLHDAVPLAAALELVHTATLVHDDINDHGHYRRGRATINELWGRTFALLTGDFLFTKVYELMAPYGELNLLFSEATTALVEGETLQAWAVKEDMLNREMYQQIVAKKTASLFRLSTLLGAKLAGADQPQADHLGEYGFYVGLAFQIVDDLLDLIGDPRLVGKDVRIDVSQRKGVASIHAAGNGNGDGSVIAPTMEAEDVTTDGDAFLAIKRRLIAGGAVDEGRQMAAVLAQQANRALDQLLSHPAVNELREIITLVVEREH